MAAQCPPETVTIEEHLGHIAQILDEGVTNFAALYGKAIFCGEALPVQAAEQVAQLARDCRALVLTVEAL